jgi:hypothetical protein
VRVRDRERGREREREREIGKEGGGKREEGEPLPPFAPPARMHTMVHVGSTYHGIVQ